MAQFLHNPSPLHKMPRTSDMDMEEKRGRDSHYLGAHMLAASTATELKAHKDEDNRRFDAIGEDVKEVKQAIVIMDERIEKRHEILRVQTITDNDKTKDEIASLQKKIAWILGVVYALSKLADWGPSVVSAVKHGGS